MKLVQALILGVISTQAIMLESEQGIVAQSKTMVFESIGEIVQDDNDQPADDSQADVSNEPKKPKDEVDKLMDAYDNVEKHEEYLKSPEFAAVQKKKKDDEIEK